jgi:SAM-dependent methyltransferase
VPPAAGRERAGGPILTDGDPPDGLTVATRHYYWKPSHALFHAFELEAYAAAGADFSRPVLDLGCGDGTFAAMLRDRGVLGAVDVAVEPDAARLRRARASGLARAVRADARALPLTAGAFGSVLANSVLNAIPDSPDACLSEVDRVLVPGGTFVLTLPTAGVDRTRLGPRVLRALGARGAAERLRERVNRRLDVLQVRDEAGWLSALERGGFRVERVLRYFTPRQAAWTNLLSLHAFRVFAPLRLLGAGSVSRLAARVEARLFRRLFAAETGLADPGRGGASILVVARKGRA